MLANKFAPFAIALVVATVVMFTNLGATRLWDRDEPRNAGCAWEMMQRGDWIVPIFNDELRHQKPVLLYWLIGSAYQVFGVNEFAARFWSSILAVGTVVLTYAIGRRLFDCTTAALGALALSTSLMFVVAGRAATPDSLLIFCQTAALAIYVCAVFAPKGTDGEPTRLRIPGNFFPAKRTDYAAMYAMMGIGVLAKGLVAIVLPMAIIGLFMVVSTYPRLNNPEQSIVSRLIQRLKALPWHFGKTLGSMRPMLAIAILVLVAGPWYLLVGLRTDGEFIRLFFWNEHFGRATSTFENHGGGLWYYPLAIAAGFFPWSVFLGPMFATAIRRSTSHEGTKHSHVFILCWIGVQVGLFSLFSTKLPSYVTPCYPALALCCAAFLVPWARQVQMPAFIDKAVFVSLGLSGAAIAAAMIFLCEKYLKGSYWLVGLGVLWFAAAIAGWNLSLQRRRPQWVCAFAGAAVIFAVGLFAFGAVAVDRTQSIEQLIEPIRAHQVPVATYRCLESSWVFYSQRPIHELATSVGEAVGDRSQYWQPKPRLSPAEFARKYPDAMFITTDQSWTELQQQLPADYQIVRYSPYFLRNKNLLLAAPSSIRVAEAYGAQPPTTSR